MTQPLSSPSVSDDFDTESRASGFLAVGGDEIHHWALQNADSDLKGSAFKACTKDRFMRASIMHLFR
jgi:hypothetical protein